MYIFLLDPCW